MGQYFTKQTDIAIGEFLQSSEPAVKNQIFETRIKPAFTKLIDSLVGVYKFYTIPGVDVDTMKRDCLTNLYEMIPKFDPNRGTKGFSYFNVVARNWFIQLSRAGRKVKLESELARGLDGVAAASHEAQHIQSFEDDVVDREKWISFFDAMGAWRDQIVKKTERQVIEAVIFLFQNPHLITMYSKKALFVYIREITGLSGKQVAVQLKRLKGLYAEWRRRELDGDDGDDDGGREEREETRSTAQQRAVRAGLEEHRGRSSSSRADAAGS